MGAAPGTCGSRRSARARCTADPLHGFVVKAGDYQGWFEHAWLERPLGEIFVTVLAAVGVTLSCTAPVQRVFRFAMEPKMEWAFKRDAAELAREREKREGSAAREKVNA
ncbi:hypothetical protein WKI71_15500 [Streptomyces sp. MS1.AVA.1]|uniref:Uncharacterized protein n=1 Tax=Streptomyces machairae TaxID=3134109 RepID=A0ABU8UKB4_9ACTN